MSLARRNIEDLKRALASDPDRIARLAEEFLGPRNEALSTRQELRFGNNGSLKVDLTGKRRGQFKSFEDGAAGSLVDLIMRGRNVSLPEAIKIGWERIDGAPWSPSPQRKAEDRAERKTRATSTYHLQLARESQPLDGTLAERYLRVHRGHTGPLPPEGRFHPSVRHKESGRSWPAWLVVAADGSGVRRVQVVFLDPETGGKAPIKPVKKTFGTDASHVPAVFEARSEGGPIWEFEGPENGCTGWALTGDRTLVTMGAGNLGKSQIPPGSHIIIGSDSGPQEQAAAREAAKRYVAAGCKVSIAHATGCKDFNEALQRFGPERTLELLHQAKPFMAHGLPLYYPAPTEARDAALSRQNTAICTTIRNAITRGAARREIDSRYEADTAGLELSRSEKIAARRRAAREVEEKWGAIPERQRLLISGAQGTGKTHTALHALAEATAALPPDAEFVAHLYEPTISKSFEAAIDYIEAARPGSLPVKVVLGRSAKDPERADGGPMCPRHQVVTRAAKRGIEVRKTICSSCPLAGSCGTMRQEREIAAMGKRGIFVHAHAYVFSPSPAPAADLVIVDESVVLQAIEDPREMSPAALTDVVPFAGSDLAAVIAANRTINQLVRALMEEKSLSALRSAGITEDDLRAAKRMVDDAIEAATPALDGDMSDDKIAQVLEGWQAGALYAASSLLAATIRERNLPRDTFTAVTFHSGRRVRVDGGEERLPRLRVHRIRRLVNVTEAASLLLLDGTADPRICSLPALFGELQHVHAPIERDAFVIGTKGKTYSRQSITGCDSRGNPMPGRAEEARKLRADIRTIYDRFVGVCGGGGMIVASKRAAEVLKADEIAPDQSDIAHFGALRGLNSWEDCPFGISVGRESVSIERLEDMARALFADDAEPFITFAVAPPADWPWQHWPYRATRGRRMRDGTVSPIETEVHPDPRVQAVLEQLREAELMQGLDRPRPIFNHRTLITMNDLVLDLTYDRVLPHEQLVSGGNRFEIAWMRSGILPLGPADLNRAHGRDFPTVSAAKEALLARGDNGGPPQILTSLGRPTIIAYRRRGQRGKASRALIDLRRHPDPLLALRAALGDIQEVHLVTGAVAASWQAAAVEPTQEANVQPADVTRAAPSGAAAPQRPGNPAEGATGVISVPLAAVPPVDPLAVAATGQTVPRQSHMLLPLPAPIPAPAATSSRPPPRLPGAPPPVGPP